MAEINRKIIGPFKQILTMNRLNVNGPLHDHQLEIIPNGGIAIEDEKIVKINNYDLLKKDLSLQGYRIEFQEKEMVLLPGLIDAHTHLCYSGSRANDFANRISGKSYLEISQEGGGIWQTVEATRRASAEELTNSLRKSVQKKLSQGVTTIEIKSGYGLELATEIKQLEVIKRVSKELNVDLISTCLAAHLTPKDFSGTPREYLKFISTELFPILQKTDLTRRIDIFIEEGAFTKDEAEDFLITAKKYQFDLTVHADQFTINGSHLAAKFHALSADHLEVSNQQDIELLKDNGVICTVLPGASLGLGQAFAPARKILDQQACLVIASDQNPGSAPHGDLMTQASILATYQRLSTAEVFAALTFRAALALNLKDRGKIAPDHRADLVAYPTTDYREILYQQGNLKPSNIWIKGINYHFSNS